MVATLDMLQSENSPEFDAITDLAAKTLDFPIAWISLVHGNEQWFKANYGLNADQTLQNLAFSSHSIKCNDPLIIKDARLDQRFKDHPLVLGPPNIVFYAGIPISIDGVQNLGTLCVIDTQPRSLDADKLDQLRSFGRVVEGLLLAFESQKQAEHAKEQEARKCIELTRTNRLLEQAKELSGVGGWELVLDPPALTWTTETKRIHEVASNFEPQIEKAIEFYAPKARPIISAAVELAISAGTGWDLELPMVTAKGKDIWVRAIGNPMFKDGSVISLVGAFQDITQRKEIETRLQESKKAALETSEELSTILRSMGEGVSVFDKDHKLTIWNQKYIEIFAKPEGEIWKGVELRTLLEHEKERGDFPGDIDAHLCNLSDQLDQGAPVVFQFRTQKGRVILSTHSQLPDGGFVGTHSDVTIQVQAVERAEYASRHDFLTGLPNRLAFNAGIKELEKKDGGENRSLVLMLVDLDKFKVINDTYGHQAGDQLLKDVAERLRNRIRKCDLVARLGGDEFAIVLECNAGDALRISEAIALDICRDMKRPFELSVGSLTVSASIGLCITSAKSLDIDMVFNKADYALYRVKNGNVGSYQYHDEALATEIAEKRGKFAVVEAAVPERNLKLAFQPIYELKSLKLCGAEALVHWSGKDYANMSASELIRVAEEAGVIEAIGIWVLNESIRAASSWNDDLIVSVNVSPTQLGKDCFLNQVERTLREYQFPSNRLELEITEDVLLAEGSGSLEELSKIQQLGVRIVLDDFGTGYSTLSYIRRFPFDKLKIDKSFIMASASERQSRAIVSSMVTLARELGIVITAEGIETQEKLQEIVAAGCDFGQGYFLARPMSADDFGAL